MVETKAEEAGVAPDEAVHQADYDKLEQEMVDAAKDEQVVAPKNIVLPTLDDPSLQASFEAYMKDPEGVPDCVIDTDTQEFEPTLDDIFVVIPSGDYQRLLFEGMELREREEQHLTDFRNFLKVKNLEIPAMYDDSNRLALRFLQGLKWNYQNTFDAIIEHSQWQGSVSKLEPSTFWPELNSGIIYGLKRDVQQHPVIIVNVRRMIDTKTDMDKLIQMCDFFLNYVITKAMVPGKTESWVAIFDMRNCGATQIPKNQIKGIVNSMSKNYRGRLFRFYATDVTFLVRSLWKLAHKFVDEFTHRKLNIYGSDYQKDLHAQVGAENLEKKYGGQLDDKVGDFFPPQFS